MNEPCRISDDKIVVPMVELSYTTSFLYMCNNFITLGIASECLLGALGDSPSVIKFEHLMEWTRNSHQIC